jgi:hypothetical protein
LHRGIIGPHDIERLEGLRDRILGPQKLRTAGKPTVRDGNTYEGGTAFERSPRAVGVKSARCYTNAYSYQNAPNIASAAAGSKSSGAMDDNLSLRREINLVSFPSSSVAIAY